MKRVLKLASLITLAAIVHLSSFAHAFEISIETDLFGPILRLAGRSGVEQYWISPGILVGERFIVRAEVFQAEGKNFSMSSTQSGGSGQVGDQNVKTSMLGGSLGYCFSGCNSDSFRAIVGVGSAERKFSDTILGDRFSNGSMWFGELGYQWRWGNAITSLSLTTIGSDLVETVTYGTPTAQLTISKNNLEPLIKWGIGLYF